MNSLGLISKLNKFYLSNLNGDNKIDLIENFVTEIDYFVSWFSSDPKVRDHLAVASANVKADLFELGE